MPIKKYKKLMKISICKSSIPEYLVFDKNSKKCFFVAEFIDDAKKRWIRKTRRIVPTILLNEII